MKYGFNVTNLCIDRLRIRLVLRSVRTIILVFAKVKSLTCRKDKVEAVMAVFKHFNLISNYNELLSAEGGFL